MQPKTPGADCAHCPLNTRPFCGPLLPPSGSTVMIIGEAPGVQEIIEGVPFVGETGAILRHMAAHAGFTVDGIALTNAVLCRPIGDEIPDEAIRACSGRLSSEVAAMGASNIIAAGDAAIRACDMLSGRNSDALGGVLARAGHTYIAPVNSGFVYTATVNPAYLFHNDGYAPNFTRHLARGINPRFDQDFDANRVRYVVMTPENADRVIDYLYSFPVGAPMAYDVETDHLQWYDTPSLDAAELLCVVITLEDWRSVIIPADMFSALHYDISPLVPANPMRAHLKTWCNRYNVIGHNVKFDQNVTAMRLGIEFDASDDTMLMHHALQELGAHGLKELGAEYLGAPDYEGALIDEWFKSHGISKDKRRYGMLPKPNLYKYAAIDGALTLQLWRLFKMQLAAEGIEYRPYKQTVMPISNALGGAEREGVPIDRQQLAEARIEFGAELETFENRMQEMIDPLLIDAEYSKPAVYAELTRLMAKKVSRPADDVLYTKAGKPKKRQTVTETVMRFNPGSPPQMHHVLYGLLGLQLTKKLVKPTGTNTGKEALEALPPHPFIDVLRQHRRVSKMLDTYIEGIDRRADVNDILHVDFRITGTEIGRLSASNGDHGIPRPDDYYGAMIRSAFVAADGEVLILGDYSQAELRAFAWLANVQFLLTKYRNGEDVHTETALMLEKLGAPAFRHFAEYFKRGKAGDDMCANAAKAMRTLAKNINFGALVYLGGPNGIAGMMGGKVAPQMIADVLAVYKPMMPEAAIYAERQFEQLRTRGYVETVFGRRRRFYIISDRNEDEARKAAVHMVVAGSAADLTNTSVVRLRALGVRVCHTVHDSIIARARPDEAEDVARVMRDVMQSTGAEFMPGIPWIADIDIADRWCARPPARAQS